MTAQRKRVLFVPEQDPVHLDTVCLLTARGSPVKECQPQAAASAPIYWSSTVTRTTAARVNRTLNSCCV